MITSPKPDQYGKRRIVIATDSTTEPITVSELKFWARIDGSDEDTVLEGIIKTARKNVEDYIRRSLIQKTIEVHMDEWESDCYELPLGPVISINSVETIAEDDTATTYSSDNYYLASGTPPRIIIKQDADYPQNTERDYGGYKITYYAGYGTTADDVPQAIKDAIAVWATYIYENRDPNPQPPMVVENLLKNFIVIRL